LAGEHTVDEQNIFAIVSTQLKENVEGLEDIEIDPSKSMLDYGASSLDIVEIVSAVLRELRIRVPRTKLAGLKTIREFVLLLAAEKGA
jgi:acyl carrier protein